MKVDTGGHALCAATLTWKSEVYSHRVRAIVQDAWRWLGTLSSCIADIAFQCTGRKVINSTLRAPLCALASLCLRFTSHLSTAEILRGSHGGGEKFDEADSSDALHRVQSCSSCSAESIVQGRHVDRLDTTRYDGWDLRDGSRFAGLRPRGLDPTCLT